jgi:hypothetical protein
MTAEFTHEAETCDCVRCSAIRFAEAVKSSREMPGSPMRRGDPCPGCREAKHLRWGIEPDGVYVYCKFCLYDSRGWPTSEVQR